MPRKKKEKEITKAIEEKKRYVECPFCKNVIHAQVGWDTSTTSCSKCGKRVAALWKDEE